MIPIMIAYEYRLNETVVRSSRRSKAGFVRRKPGSSRRVTSANRGAVGLVGWYWHFVDGVWVVVFTVVYLVGR